MKLYDPATRAMGLINSRGGIMKRIIVLVAALGALAVPAMASAQSTGHRQPCSVQHRYLGSRSHYRWRRGTAQNRADESLKTTTYRYGPGSCHRIAFRRWRQIISLVFAHQGHGSFSGPGIIGSWRHIKTLEVPHTCEGDGSPASESAPYGWFALRVSDLDGRLIGTGTVKLRLAC